MMAAVKRASKMREKEMEIHAEMITQKLIAAWNSGQKKSRRKGK